VNIRPIFPKIFVIICLVGALSLFVKPASGAGDPDETTDFSFLEGMALVVLEDGSVPALHEARQLIESYGGRIAIMSPPSMLIGWIPFELREELIGLAGIEDIYFTEVPAGEVRTAGAPDRAMVSWFNAVTTGEIRQRMESDQRPGLDNSPGAPQTPRKPDMRIPPAFDKVSFLENMESVGLDVQALKERGLYPDGTAAYGGNSLAMTGTIALSIFFVESDGSGTDPDQYTWTEEDMQKYLDHAATGMTWWASRAASQTGCFATFLLYYYSADDPRCQQWVEPVLHDTSYEADWVEAIMSNFGYTSGNRWSMVDAFNTWQRSTYQTARAYSAFICYNPFPSPQSFPDDHTAYAWYYGPYFVSLFRTGWTPSQTFTHETGHIFGACDEYAGGCGSGSCTSVCANDVLNVNCEVCNSKSVACMMKANTWSLCAYTPGQLGWEIVPCTPAAPPALPAPTVAASLPASMYQGLDGTVTVTGTHFYAGAWVKFGPEVFVHKTTLVGTETLIVDVTVFNDAPPGLYNITVKNRDFQSATLTNALEVLATTRHYFSPSGANNFPYITPADAATDLADAVDAAYQGDTLMVPSMTLNNFSMTLEKGVLLHGAWNADFSSRDLAAGKTVLNLAGDISLFPGADQGGLDGFVIENGTGLPVIVPFNGDVGGGIRVINTNAIIANCEIRNNAATGGTTLGAGGGIYADGAVVDIRDNYIHDNTATWGGGMYLYNCSGTVSNNTVSGNTVRATTDPPQGAGIYLADCDGIVLDGNTIDTNTGATDGGGLLVNNGSGTVVSGGSISRNSCTYLGGGSV
jgi:parallel beta-helix repeat protein